MKGYYTKENELIKNVLAIGCKDILNDQTVGSCFNRLRNFNEELHRHSVNVSIISVIMGIYVGMSMSDIRNLFVSGLLHDYGKLYIPKGILDKPDVLTEIERRRIENHVYLGYCNLMDEKCFSNKILLGVLEHHERMDGSGYLKKSEGNISEFAMIIMIADVYDAMITDRVYRTRVDRNVVYEYLFINAGRHFNKLLTKNFINHTLSMDLDYVIKIVERRVFDHNNIDEMRISL